MRSRREDGAVKIAKLEQHRPELRTQQFRDVDEIVEFLVAIQEHFLVGYGLRDFQREYEIIGSFARPSCDRRSRWRSVERGIHFNRVKARCVVGEVIGGLHAGWIEGVFPSSSSECGGSEMDATHLSLGAQICIYRLLTD